MRRCLVLLSIPLVPLLVALEEEGRTQAFAHTAPVLATASDEPVAELDLGALRGKVVVIEVMETWCGVCRTAIPTLNRWHERFADAGLYVVVASPESAEVLRRYRDGNDLGAHIAVDVDGAVARRFEVSAFPTFILLDREGEPRGKFRGAGEQLAKVESAFTALLDASPYVPDGVRFSAP